MYAMLTLVVVGFLAACSAASADEDAERTENLYAGGDMSTIENAKEIFGEFTQEEFDKRIVSGAKSKVGEWPWLVGIHKSRILGVICGGSIIDATTVVTAAHCFRRSQRPSLYTVLVGQTDLHAVRTQQRYRVTAVRPHKGYIFRLGANSPNDIAILKLARPIKFSKAVRPIALPSGPNDAAPVESSCYAGGWGRTQSKQWTLQMFHVSIRIRNMRMCRAMYAYNQFRKPQTQVCAGGHTFSNVCVGDSGGPLACKRRGKHILEGVVSFGAHFCGKLRRKYPTVFTRIASFLDWIKANRH